MGAVERLAWRADEGYRRASALLRQMATPDGLLPSQIQPSEILDSPELKLLRELLLSAIADVAVPAHHVCCRVSCKYLKNARLAWSWIDGEPGASVSFEMACAAFGLAPDEMRKRIARCLAPFASNRHGGSRFAVGNWKRSRVPPHNSPTWTGTTISKKSSIRYTARSKR
jgi:hypothetical protein